MKSGIDSRIEREMDELLTEEKWQAILSNNSACDGTFFYAVRTTGIFCRPSCKSKAPKRENVAVFSVAEQALAAGFRPCKRCKPTGERLPDAEWVELMTRYMDNHLAEPVKLGHLAEVCHGSPYHLHRTFKKVTGITPVDYLQQQRVAKAKQDLLHTEQGVAEIGQSVGLPNTSYFITLFKSKTGYTPSQFRQLYQTQTQAGEEYISTKEASKYE
ncbi:AraC family transcriptional regulator [Bacillus sp. FJAT-27264]|uniref:bifunctional transcriptional activator/DNA repair enzyme AdaA n=1 Tax=Paenibacillus sp. (strain DSM 101736 / FJAT-27264) TaxID=1850362 RepID=UPI000807D3B1|nr:bifunctional transcriptional activator/DNA repair enzyme AdaA [Bacillus sp. FJAT-27264]OBZ18287.1 AraC family transcriptional regulator [Bacillus sp. FJAT-27264]